MKIKKQAIKDDEDNASLFEWGNKRINHTFMLLDGILEVSFPLQLVGKNQVYLRCGDRECLKTENLFSFINQIYAYNTYGRFTQLNLGINNDYSCPLLKKGQKTKDRFQYLINRTANVEMAESDIVLGSDDKIRETITKLIKSKHKNIVIECTCMNKLIGSDILSIIDNIDVPHKCNILYDHNEQRYLLNDFIKKYAYIFDKNKKSFNNKDRKINLLGYKLDQSMQEMISLLSLFKINLNISFLPKVDLDSLKNLYNANLSVLYPEELYENIYDKIQMNKILPESPYGFKKSILWLNSITDFFGISLNNNKLWHEYYQPRFIRWNNLIKRAQQFKLGFIVSEKEEEILTNPKKFPEGVNMLSILEEMGFKLQLFIITSKNKFIPIKEKLKSNFIFKNKHEINLIENTDLIDKFLSKSNCHCFYSDIYHDEKIILNGKNIFSFFIFEKGFDGAIRSLEKLLNFCEIDFFRKYKKNNSVYLKPVNLQILSENLWTK